MTEEKEGGLEEEQQLDVNYDGSTMAEKKLAETVSTFQRNIISNVFPNIDSNEGHAHWEWEAEKKKKMFNRQSLKDDDELQGTKKFEETLSSFLNFIGK